MNRIVFLNIGWMKSYKGLKKDSIKGGGSYVDEHGAGGEMYNFFQIPKDDYYYGFCGGIRGIDIHRLDPSIKGDKLEDVLVVWVAKDPSGGGGKVVGWYKNAIIYNEYQDPPAEPIWQYCVKAKKNDCVVIVKTIERVQKIPRGKGGFGQSNIWYADSPKGKGIREKVLTFINNYEKGAIHRNIKKGSARSKHNPDPLMRQKVEKKAIEITTNYYKKYGFTVVSKEKDNIGWDLEADNGDTSLKIEVKGLSGDSINIGLTPNEYNEMKRNTFSYRISVVTQALTESPQLSIFEYSPEIDAWEDEDQTMRLKIKEITSANLTA